MKPIHDNILDCLKLVADWDVRIIIIGDTPKSKALREVVALARKKLAELNEV
jgi:hypothetical protein